ncbi:MARTX multifunctional-autoprocessing repeats-in-toxin holotoxin RtxA [Vibrio cholerae]|uniref:MARTX multifunctional-autoprocessing repeats-in-toxin holotoxin RtxA n=1 Tax=Vibrio cholerae TaxID=666 RepID=UPI0020890162|nr:MARTX multifunctional-autoprocessing repeats-in-toxin holotoxin RtxA [Vibrio cholerae]ELJ8536672.1 MARTX multifunctional-autoprocessing repeats-in-toxin holotoxin RtxA [Vibrio cholerae]ELJ8576997.1 MARTX multifunctional-autoprocessing repeats-in-toxin holotoxin RtxA [Vibrio cholerae]MCQ0984743.1 MARTX multifunctional-autoprocessing repeats-in-toxin holotoxin RtxA [Vibrio cholerae]GIA16421.1 RTX toxin RtxA [Vibrio cholerae]
MGKPFWRSVEYFFTGNYSADDGNNNIVAIGFGGQIHAYGGDDHVTVGSIGATVYTGSGNDTVVGGSAYLKVEDSTGHLTVKGAAGYADINKSGDGNVSFAGAAGGVSIDHLGNHGDVSYGGAAAYNGITRKGLSGNVTFAGAGGYNALWHETNQGNLSFTGAGAGNKLDRTWFNRYQGSHGDVTFDGAGAANSISSRVETGNITFRGAGTDNHLVRKGKVGDITLQGAGASNRIERTHQAEDVYTQTRGNIRFEGVGGYNSLYSDVAHGDIHFSGGGAYNTIIRKGSGNDFAKEGMTNAKADEIVLTKAVMSGSWIGQDHHVTAVKSASEPNTYLFAFADSTYTKINKVQLRNDPQTGELKYYSTAWYKEGNHLSNLANQDISDNGGFTAVNINGAYTLSDLKVEHQQSVTVHAVEKSLTEYEWVTYANGAVIDAKEVSLSDAKMGGHAIYADGTKVDVKAVKSNRQPNTYIYAKVLGPYTKIVVVELANDPETGALKYQARSWYKEGDHTANIANQDISSATGYNPMGKGGYSLSDLHYSVNAVRSTSETVADIEEYTDQTLFKPANDSGESSGDVRFNGAGGGNVIKSNVTRGNVHFNGGGIANVILHSSQFGNTEFNGGGAANVIVKSGEEGDLTFRGAGLANVLVHQSQQGKMDVYAGGAVNVLVRLGDGQYLAHLLAYGNISVQKGSGDSRVVMLGGYNTHTQIGSGNGLWLAAGGFNVMTQVGQGDVAAVLAGGANVLTKMGEGELTSGMLGGANVITHISNDDQLSNTTAVALGGANILTKKGKGNTLAVMGGGANVLTHVGYGTTTGVMVGGANILTKVGNGDTTGIMLGVGNVLTHVGDGQTLGVMGAAGNIFTKVGDGTSIAVMIGAGNIFTHVGEGNAWALMGGLGNVFTKVGNGDALALMVAEANVFTHIGDGMSVALMLAKGNVATKVGNGTTLAAMVGNANIFTHIGHGSTFAAMIGQANIMTKVGNDLTAALMVGKANIMTHVGDGTSLGLFAGEVNVMTKVGNGSTLAAMFGKANIMTHVGDGLTGVLALGEANIVTKVGDDFMGVVAAAKANVVTHVGDATTAAVLAGKGNILTKVGEGTTVGLLISDVGNVMTHVGDGTTIGIAKGKANLITKVGDGLGVNVAWGQANVFTQVGDGDRYNFAKGEANLITKVGDGQEVSVVQGEANIITHVGNGDDYTGAWGKANVITKVGHGQNVVLAKGEANIVTQVGDGDSFNALWSKGNIVTKVGDGMQVTAAKGQANITTTVGNGLNVTAAYGDANINTKVGDGVSVNVAWGKYNINTKVGDGLNVAVMKGKANANIHVGDGLNINASYAQNNVAIKVGNGDFYSLAVASSNTSSNKLSALFDNIKQTVLGVGGSQAINYLVQGDEASSSGTHKGRGAIATPEITKLDGFQMDAIKEVGSDLGDSLTGSVTKVDTPDLNKMQHALNVDDSSVQAPNLIVNGDFEQGAHGWQSTHGVEASYAGSVYGVEGEGHGARVTELDTYTNTSLYQDLANLAQGEVIAVSFDFAKRVGLSNNEGIEVLWNGEVVFSSSGDESAWQQKTLKLTAQAGSNRIEFKGTGHNDGLGYILDNVVATSESSQQANAIREHATQNPAAQNALSDKERAEADRQRLEQEKQKQLDAVAGSQSQLESTDQQALENNGQAQRDAVQEESEAITAELTKLAQGLDVLDGQATHTGESGDQWRNEFASGLLAGVQTQLDDAKQLANDKIAEAKQTHADNQNKVKDAVAKSEAGVAKGEQNRAGAEQDIADAQADAEKRKADALAKGKDAQQAESDAHHAVNNAQSRGDRDVQVAENKANQAQADAQGAKQNEGDRPDRQGVTGSGLSGNAHSVEGAGETDSHVKTDSQTNADGRFSEGLTEQEQEALEGATNAVNRLQINAGIRAKNSGSSMTSMFSETNSKSIVVPTKVSPEPDRQEVTRRDVRISGVNLESLSAVQGSQPTGQLASKSVPGFKSHFASTSIGIENELSGLVVVLPKNSAQTFGYVHDSQGNPLFMLTKDMNQGGYSNPVGINDIQGVNNWQTHTVELVTYPSEISDTAAVESRKEAMLWLAKEFTDHINQSNHQSLPHLVSDDGRFTLVISNSKHLIAAGNGTSIDAEGKTIGMTPSGQQATMAISAKEFGTSSSSEVRLLESAPWYQAGLRDEFLANAKNTTLDDPATAQNVYAYLTSVYSKTADLAKEYGIYINDWDPASEGFSPNAQGLTDPKVKNAWSILPRTKPVRMLELLSAEDSRYVRQQIAEKLKGTYSESLAKNVFEYFQYGGEVAGHGINNATTGSVQQPEPAILFEFRSVPSALSDFVPKTASTVKVDVKALDHFDSASRKAIITEVNALVSGSEDFDAWYQEYRASKGQPPVKNPKSSASANHKAEWLMTQHAEQWAKITAPYTDNHETLTSTKLASNDKEELHALGETSNLEHNKQQENVASIINTMLNDMLPFYALRTERNLLVQEGDEGFEVRAWPGTEDKSKTIILEDPEDAAQHKAIERFILANFDNFEQMPDELFLVDNKVISHHEGRTHVLAQRVDGAWQYNAKVELMSVTELLDAANVTGKIRGESYQQVIDALTDYHASITEHADYEPESVEKLLNLRKKIEGYVLGHPDSGRVEAMNSLLNQVNTRLDEVSLLSVAEQTIQAQDSFSRLYDQLEAANLKESKHLYLDQNGDFVTKGKGNLANIDLLGSREAVLEKVKLTVSNEYGQTVADTIFAGLSAKDLAKDGKGIDIAGLNKVHQAIEQHLSPVSATLYIWKPSDHSALGHAALQIGQGRTQLEGQAAADFNQQNYVSWWPLGSKSSNISNILNVATKDQPDLKLRWSDFSQPAHQNDTLEHDVASEENDGFGLHDGDIKLKRFIEKLNAAKGIDASFKEASEGYASVLLGNPDMLETTGIPAHVFQPFVEQWNDTSYDMMDVANRFAQELRLQAQRSDDPELLEKRIGNVVRQFAERALEEIETFKASQADQGRVFRINLEGLDVAAMQAEWHRLSNDPDARYQLLTKNCSSTVAKVLKAGGADKLIGHTWLPKFGVWTPPELFNFGQALQEAQLEITAKKQSHQVTDVLDALSGNKAKVAVDLAQIFTVQELKERAKVFAKPIGASYQGILDQLDLVHQAKGRYQIAASFELNKKINDYIAEHPTSGRNQALTQLKEQVTSALFIGKMQIAQAGIDAIAQTRPELATRIFMVAIEEANGKHVGLTDMMLRWANEDPYLAPKHGYKGEMPSDLGFDAKYHVDLGEHYADFKQWLETSQSNGLLSKATLDESTKTVHLGYSYQELQDLTGAESVQMAFYFLKEAAKKADPISGDSAEMILLKKFADQNYLSQLDSDRMDQIEGIYRSSHETDVDAWDRRYSGKGYDELTNMLASATGVDEQLSVLLDDRKGLLIGEVHGSDVNGLRFVNEQMEALKKQGVTVIGLEHLRSDLAQPLIDRYLATGVMSSELSAMLKTKHLDVTLFENARVNGMRIVALDANSSARPNVQGTEHGLMYRAGAANNIAVEVLQNLPDGEKFVAIYGKAHLQSHKGIEGFVPGITHRLDLPALKVSDSNQFTVEQDDVSLRVVYDDVANKPKITFKGSLSGANTALHNQNVNDWERVVVTPIADGGETRFDGQIIVQMENDPVVAKAAANLAGKHAESSVVVQLDSDGNYRVVYGDPSKLDGKLRWQLVGHGRDHSESNNTRLSGYSADELAVKLAKFQQSFNQAENINKKPDHISIVGCSLVSDDKQKGFGHQFINAMDANGLRVDVSVRSSELAVDEAGRKHTKDANGDWVQKAENNKVSLSWDAQGEVVAKDERIRNGIAEGDIDLSRIGVSDVDEPARGAIGDNSDVFDAPEKRKPETEVIANSSSSNQLSYSGNIQVNVGEGEFTAVNWGTSNVGIKVGTGGFKSLAFGDNNVMVHIGDGESKHSVDIGGYQALEGAQMFLGNRNVSFNFGHSNDLILMMDKSIPTPPLVNPFDGAARISGVLQSIATSGEGEDWLAAQEQQWTLSGAKKFVKDMSGLDQSSSVDYTHLVQLNSQNERDSRGLKHDAEATLNKQYNQWLSGNGNSGTSQLSRADKLRQANEKLAFNFAVGGQGADIQVTTGNWNFIFGDNIQSILDTNLGSLFGLMTQQFTATGQAKTTFTYTPQDLPRQLKNKLLGQLAGVGAETTLADIFGVDYTASGQIVSRNGQAVDGVAILKEMLEVIGEFSGDQLQAFVDPAKLLDSLKAGIDMGADGIKSFAETHGLKEKAPEEEKDNSSVSVNGANVNSAQGATMADGNTETAETQDRALGFNSLNLPNLFATIFSQDKQKEMKSLVENLKQNLTADLLNMKEKTFDFLRNSGHLQGDGDINISLGNYNFNWGGDGKDLGAYLGDNNNFWGGRGDDVFYATGTSNIFTSGEGNDMGVLMGRENMMFGGDGNDTAVVAGRINHVFLGAGDDQSFVFGEGGEIDTGSGRDYVVTSGNFNRVDTGDDQDYSVTIGNNNQVELGAGNDFANVFGNYNRINAGAGNDVVKLMGYHAVLNGGDGDDHLIATAISKFSQFNGGEGRDLMVLGGYQNTFKGGTDVDSFVVSGDVIDNLVEDIRSEDNIVFNGIDWQKLWFERSGYDLKLSILRDPSNDSDQSKFEHIGSVTFSDYFNGNRAQVVIGMSDKDLSGEREYTMLSDSAIDALVQAMSGFEPQAGDNGFIDSLESKSQAAISMAWSDVVHKKGLMV